MPKNTKTQKMQKTKTSVFVQNRKKKEMEILALCVITFEPIISKHLKMTFRTSVLCKRWTYICKKMARKGYTQIIYKGTFVLQ